MGCIPVDRGLSEFFDKRLKRKRPPPFTREQLDNANEEEFMDMKLKLRRYNRPRTWVTDANGRRKIVLKQVERTLPISADSWRFYQQEKKARELFDQKCKEPYSGASDTSSYGSDDLSEVEGLPSAPVDVPAAEFDAPLDVEIDGKIGIVEALPCDALNENMSHEKAVIEKAEEKTPMQKKRRSIPQSPARISVKKMKKKKKKQQQIDGEIAVVSEDNNVVALIERLITREMTTMKKELLKMFKAHLTKKKKSRSILNSDDCETR